MLSFQATLALSRIHWILCRQKGRFFHSKGMLLAIFIVSGHILLSRHRFLFTHKVGYDGLAVLLFRQEVLDQLWCRWRELTTLMQLGFLCLLLSISLVVWASISLASLGAVVTLQISQLVLHDLKLLNSRFIHLFSRSFLLLGVCDQHAIFATFTSHRSLFKLHIVHEVNLYLPPRIFPTTALHKSSWHWVLLTTKHTRSCLLQLRRHQLSIKSTLATRRQYQVWLLPLLQQSSQVVKWRANWRGVTWLSCLDSGHWGAFWADFRRVGYGVLWHFLVILYLMLEGWCDDDLAARRRLFFDSECDLAS